MIAHKLVFHSHPKIRLIFLLLVALVVNEKFDPLCKVELEVGGPTESTYLLEQVRATGST